MSPQSNVQVQSLAHGGQTFLTFVSSKYGVLGPVADSHPNFSEIAKFAEAAILGNPVDEDALKVALDPAQAVAEAFEPLSERVAVKGGKVYFDNDPVEGPLEDQIVQFLKDGEDFYPLVEFYEKLHTNPLGDVREGLYSWIEGQTSGNAGYNGKDKNAGALTITEDGDLIGYKAFIRATPEWREDVRGDVLVPSRRGEGIVNGVEVPADKYIEQVEGDIVEMPRSKVLHAPSQDCGTGLHIGTYAYASTFASVVCLVRFSPRDIVSLPDSNSTWKLRVCRYEVLGEVSEPLDVPVYRDGDENDILV